jgi:hypothetical protein
MDERLALGRLFGERAEAPAEAHLNVGERVHIRVPEASGALQHRGVVCSVMSSNVLTVVAYFSEIRSQRRSLISRSATSVE